MFDTTELKSLYKGLFIKMNINKKKILLKDNIGKNKILIINTKKKDLLHVNQFDNKIKKNNHNKKPFYLNSYLP